MPGAKRRGLGRWSIGPCCGCGGDRPCVVGLCLDVEATCGGGENQAVRLTVTPVGGGDPIEGDTGSDGRACVDLPGAGDYNVVATKDGCRLSTDWTNPVAVECGETRMLVGRIKCAGKGELRYTVLGCHSLPLPGAVVTATPTGGGAAASAGTGPDGIAILYPVVAGPHEIVVTHGSGRFAPKTDPVKPTLTPCGATAYGSCTLLPATGYTCCNPAFGSPYPLPNTLYVTDGGGTATLAGPCGGTVCANRSMDHVSVEMGDLNSCGLVTRTCQPGAPGGLYQRPPTLGTAMSRVTYTVNLTGTPAARQSIPSNTTYDFLLDPYPGPCNVGVDQKLRSRWRCPTACGAASSEAMAFDSIGFTLNSAYPFNATFTFNPAGDWVTGSTGTPMGQPYTASIVIHE